MRERILPYVSINLLKLPQLSAGVAQSGGNNSRIVGVNWAAVVVVALGMLIACDNLL